MTFPGIPLLIQKKILLGLLAGSCLAVFLTLIFYSADEHAPLQNLSQADSLIQEELSRFRVPADRIRVIDYAVTDDFIRKRYVVLLPQGVSQTHFHSELNRKLHPYRVETVGYAEVPEGEINILILFENKIIRTIELRTDPDRS